jgi:hypothetical protein
VQQLSENEIYNLLCHWIDKKIVVRENHIFWIGNLNTKKIKVIWPNLVGHTPKFRGNKLDIKEQELFCIFY